MALVRGGATVAVLVHPDDLARWEALDDAADEAAASKRLAEYDRTRGAGWARLEELAAREGVTVADLMHLPQ